MAPVFLFPTQEATPLLIVPLGIMVDPENDGEINSIKTVSQF
jgi:hypothetical protein